MVKYLHAAHDISISKVCDLTSASTSIYYHQSTCDDGPVIAALTELRDRHPRRGLGVFYKRLRAAGHPWNRKRVPQVYKSFGLQIRKPLRKRFPTRDPRPLTPPEATMEGWSIDFMADALRNGRKSRVLNIIDDFNRESVW